MIILKSCRNSKKKYTKMIEIAKIDKIEKNRQYWKQNRQN